MRKIITNRALINVPQFTILFSYPLHIIFLYKCSLFMKPGIKILRYMSSGLHFLVKGHMSCVYKKRRQAQNGVTSAKPTSSIQDIISNLIKVSASSRNVILKQLIWNFLVSNGEIRIHPFPVPKKDEVICPFLVPLLFCL